MMLKVRIFRVFGAGSVAGKMARPAKRNVRWSAIPLMVRGRGSLRLGVITISRASYEFQARMARVLGQPTLMSLQP